MLGVSVDDGLFQLNPFSEISKKLKPEVKERYGHDMFQISDLASNKFDEQSCMVYRILRCAGVRLAEFLWIEKVDIDIENASLHIVPKLDRCLKNTANERSVPIHSNIESCLKELLDGNTDREALSNDVLVSPSGAQMFDLKKLANPEAEISRFQLISA